MMKNIKTYSAALLMAWAFLRVAISLIQCLIIVQK